MIQEERFNNILDLIKKQRTATLEELGSLNHVSIDTVRRDLIHLEKTGLLRRVRGGAMIQNDDRQLQSLNSRILSNKEGKADLARAVRQVLHEGQMVALNHGSTNIEIAKFLCENYENLTILTTSFPVLNILCEAKKFSVILPGGIADFNECCLYSGHCEREIRKYNIDVALLAVNALSLTKGVMDFRLNEVGIIQAMLDSASHKYIVADSSKFETLSCINLCPLSEVDALITDSSLDRDILAQYELAGIHVLLPE
jgi:DeoR/GlpR family transcriptional regulator of sugar metabolism